MMVVERAEFRSLAELQNRHMELLGQSERAEDDQTFISQLESFVQAGRATGTLLEEPADRRSAQSILDYWTAFLYRTRSESGPTVLDDFDPSVTARPLGDDECPYPGLRAFGETEAQSFFGRELLITELVVRVRARRLLAVTGPASSGKTSVVMAGLLPALKAGRLEGSAGWHYFDPVTPGTAPLHELASQLVALHVNETPGSPAYAALVAAEIEALRNEPCHLRERLRGLRNSVLVVDQLEAVLASAPADGQALLSNLGALADDPNSTCRVIVIARSGGSGFAEAAATLLAADVSVEVPPLGARELRDAIVQPADAVGLKYADGLVADLVRSLVAAPNSLSVLQFVLHELWARRTKNRITATTYRSLLWDDQRHRPNPPSALARAAEAAYARCRGAADQQRARRIFTSLVEAGDTWDLRFNRVRRSSLSPTPAEAIRTNRVLEQFVQAGVIRLTADGDADNPNVELTHESLPRFWQVLADWLRDERELHLERLLTVATATDWDRRGRPRGALWHDSRLRAALRFRDDANPTVRAFIKRSLRSDVNRLLLRVGVAVVAKVMLIAVVVELLLLVGQQADSARGANSRQLAAQADLVAGTRMDLALLLGLNAYHVEPTHEARSALLSALETNPFASAILPDEQHAKALVMSPDGQWLAAGNEDGSILVWATAEKSAPRKLTSPRPTSVQTLAFSPDGSTLVATHGTGDGGTPFEVWSVRDGTQRSAVTQPPPGFTALASSVSSHGEVALLSARSVLLGPLESDATAFRSIQIGAGGSSQASTLAFNADGTLLAVAACGSDNGAKCNLSTVSLFDVASGNLLGALPVSAAVTSLDLGQSTGYPLLVAAGVTDGSSIVWGFDDPAGLVSSAHIASQTPAGVYTAKAVKLNREGDRLFVGRCRPVDRDRCVDGGVQIWDTLGDPQLQQSIPGRIDNSQYFAFSRTGGRIAMADSERVTVWDVTGRQLEVTPHTSDQPSAGVVARSLAAGVVASAQCENPDPTRSCRGAIQLSSLDGGRIGGLLEGARQDQGIASLAFDGPGTRLASGGGDGTVLLWDTAARRQLDLNLRRGNASIWGLAFSHSGGGDLLAVADDNERVSIWDTRTDSLVTELPLAKVGLRSVAFSPDDKLVAAGTSDGRILVWDVATRRLLVPPLTGHVGWVRILAFAQPRNLRLLASVDRNNTITVWDVDAGRPLAYPPNMNDKPVTGVELLEEPATHDIRLVTHDADRDASWTLHLSLDEGDLTARVCSIVRSNLTELEEERFFPRTIDFPRSWLEAPAKPIRCAEPGTSN
jgi:WD40 repeat protein